MLLTFLAVCFAGLAFMFFCIQRAQEKLLKTMQEEHAQMRTVLRAMEARLNVLDAADIQAGEQTSSDVPRMRFAREPEAPPVDDQPLHLQGATVAEAAEMLRTGSPLLDMDLQMNEPVRRSTRKENNGMPDLKL